MSHTSDLCQKEYPVAQKPEEWPHGPRMLLGGAITPCVGLAMVPVTELGPLSVHTGGFPAETVSHRNPCHRLAQLLSLIEKQSRWPGLVFLHSHHSVLFQGPITGKFDFDEKCNLVASSSSENSRLQLSPMHFPPPGNCAS